jgi:hypothetical protein
LVSFGVKALILTFLYLALVGYGLSANIKAGPLAVGAGLGVGWLVLGVCLCASQRWAVYVGLGFGAISLLPHVGLLVATYSGQPGFHDPLVRVIGWGGVAAVFGLVITPGVAALSLMGSKQRSGSP